MCITPVHGKRGREMGSYCRSRSFVNDRSESTKGKERDMIGVALEKAPQIIDYRMLTIGLVTMEEWDG